MKRFIVLIVLSIVNLGASTRCFYCDAKSPSTNYDHTSWKEFDIVSVDKSCNRTCQGTIYEKEGYESIILYYTFALCSGQNLKNSAFKIDKRALNSKEYCFKCWPKLEIGGATLKMEVAKEGGEYRARYFLQNRPIDIYEEHTVKTTF